MNAETQNDDSGSSIWSLWVDGCAGLKPSDRRNFLSLSRWQLMWALSLAAVAFAREFGIQFEWATGDGVAAGLAAIPFVFACLTLRAYARFLGSADELAQKIQAEGLKMALAAVILYLSVHPLVEKLGVGPTEFPTPLLFILLGHFLGQTLAARRYR